ncbi:hypothetical protein Syun_017551 [Stephania yunnanensis]|uniref:Replication protein A 70 kDa DNA-binding subunit B/D first OB fold domain-containing protein n=1 Tax=Stephania yunnanensis TaxID=152371 RepID=A0AAP0P3G8_9MAGN
MPRVKKPLKDIDPNTVNWYADVYVLEKLPIKQSNNSSVMQQRLILVDEEGYRIQATIFGNDINLFESRLQTKVACRISNAFVKEIEARYRLVPSPHQWSISRNTLIKKVPDSETFPLIEEVKFVTLYEIDEYLDIDEYIATHSSSTIDLVDDSERAQTLSQWFNRNFTVIEDLINNDGMSIPIHFRNPIVRPSQRRPLVTIAKINSMLNDVAIAVLNVEQSLWFMSYHNCFKFTNAEVGEVFYCTNCNHEDAHDTPRGRIEVELSDESCALKVVAYGSIAEDIISLNAQEIMTKTMARALPMRGSRTEPITSVHDLAHEEIDRIVVRQFKFEESRLEQIQDLEAKLQRRRQELTQTTPDQPVDDEVVYYKVAGECPKGRVYDLGSLGRKKRIYADADASTSQVLAQRGMGGMGNFMIFSTPKELLEGVQAMEQGAADLEKGEATAADLEKREAAATNSATVVAHLTIDRVGILERGDGAATAHELNGDGGGGDDDGNGGGGRSPATVRREMVLQGVTIEMAL